VISADSREIPALAGEFERCHNVRVCLGGILFAIRRNRDRIRKPLFFLSAPPGAGSSTFFHACWRRSSANESCSGVKTYTDAVNSPDAKGRARSGIIPVVNQNNNLKCHDFISIL
jgi:hypothetical protein